MNPLANFLFETDQVSSVTPPCGTLDICNDSAGLHVHTAGVRGISLSTFGELSSCRLDPLSDCSGTTRT